MADFFKIYAPDITLPENLTFTEKALNVLMGFLPMEKP